MVALAALLVGAIGWVEVQTSARVALGMALLAPVALVAWVGSRAQTVFIAALGVLVWLAADVTTRQALGAPTLLVANTLIRALVLVGAGVLLNSLSARLREHERLGRLDPLTEVLNRRAFLERLDYALVLARRNREPLTLVYVDIDDFKHVNDSHGHDEGDHVLQRVALVLQQCTRRSDSVARLGGDEFALLLPNTDLAGTATMLADVRDRLRALHGADRNAPTCSIGAVEFHDGELSAAAAVTQADRLMYAVKTTGKDGFVLGRFDARAATVVRVAPEAALEEPAPNQPRSPPSSSLSSDCLPPLAAERGSGPTVMER